MAAVCCKFVLQTKLHLKASRYVFRHSSGSDLDQELSVAHDNAVERGLRGLADAARAASPPLRTRTLPSTCVCFRWRCATKGLRTTPHAHLATDDIFALRPTAPFRTRIPPRLTDTGVALAHLDSRLDRALSSNRKWGYTMRTTTSRLSAASARRPNSGSTTGAARRPVLAVEHASVSSSSAKKSCDLTCRTYKSPQTLRCALSSLLRHLKHACAGADNRYRAQLWVWPIRLGSEVFMYFCFHLLC